MHRTGQVSHWQLQASEQQAEEASCRAQAATATAADLQQHVTWQEARIKELQSQVSLCSAAPVLVAAPAINPTSAWLALRLDSSSHVP